MSKVDEETNVLSFYVLCNEANIDTNKKLAKTFSKLEEKNIFTDYWDLVDAVVQSLVELAKKDKVVKEAAALALAYIQTLENEKSHDETEKTRLKEEIKRINKTISSTEESH